jgi:hypothetical protein
MSADDSSYDAATASPKWSSGMGALSQAVAGVAIQFRRSAHGRGRSLSDDRVGCMVWSATPGTVRDGAPTQAAVEPERRRVASSSAPPAASSPPAIHADSPVWEPV